MASLEKRGHFYRIVFRSGGRKFTRGLKTRDAKEAKGYLARLEDSLRRVELGTLIPSRSAKHPESGADHTAAERWAITANHLGFRCVRPVVFQTK